MSNTKTKYNLEYRFNDEYKVVDGVDATSFQEAILIDGSPNVIDLDISKSNYFIVDLEDGQPTSRRTITINPINDTETSRFEILFIEPLGVRRFLDGDFIFPDFFQTNKNTSYNENIDHRFVFRGGFRRLLLMSSKKSEGQYSAICTPWFDSESVSVPIIFIISNLSTSYEGIITIKTDGYNFPEENIEEIFSNSMAILKPRGYSYNYTINISGHSTLTGTISAADTNNLDFIIITRYLI